MDSVEHELVISDKKRVTVLRVVEEVHDVCKCGTDLCCSSSHYCEEEERVLERTALVV